VQELLGLDWDDADAVFALDLALRLHALATSPASSGVDIG
jgi:DNA-binding PucR family transcriptional regulator